MILDDKVKVVTRRFKTIVEKKYNVIDMKLFGSSARGTQGQNSDIDIMVKLDEVNRDIEENLYDIAYELELEYDCLIDVIVISDDWNIKIPLYQKIEQEGIVI